MSPLHDEHLKGYAVYRWLQKTCSAASRSRPAWIAVAVVSLAYFAATCYIASLKPFWYDELTTYHIAKAPTVADVWRTWLASADGLPPITHFIAHFVHVTLGFSHVTARLPDMVGYWLMCLCIFVFLRRRVGPILALAGMLLPLTVPAAYAYAYEMRGYGLVAGFAACAVACWDLARDTRLRRVSLFGVPLFLVAATATQPLAILIVVPLALGELARTVERARLDMWMCLGLSAPVLLLLPANPVMTHLTSLTELTRHSAADRLRVLQQLFDVWPQFLSIPATYAGLLALACLAQTGTYRSSDPDSRVPATERPQIADWVLVICIMALPALSWLLAHFAIGLVQFRYVIATVIGFSAAVPLLCWLGIRRRPELALLLAAWVTVTAVASVVDSWYTLRTKNVSTAHIAAGEHCFRLLRAWRTLPPDDLPIVVSHIYVYHQLHHYAPEALKQRLVFIVDREFGRVIIPTMPFQRQVFGERMQEADEFVRSHDSFYLYDCGDAGKWPLVAWLLRAGASLRDGGLGRDVDIRLARDLYRVSMKNGSTPGANGQ